MVEKGWNEGENIADRDRLPCTNIVISASHNKIRKRWYHLFRSSRDIADSRIMRKAYKDAARGSDCVSHNFLRAEGEEIDENKFLIPIVGHIPVVAFEMVYAAMLGLNTSVVGSDEVGKVVEAVKTSKKIPERNLDKIVFAHEGSKLSLPNSIQRGSDALHISDTDIFVFASADIPFAFADLELLLDPDWNDHDVILNFNSKQSMFQDKEPFISRNYYHIYFDEDDRQHHFKEPNIWQFSRKALEYILRAAPVMYENRQGGGVGLKEVAKLAAKRVWHNWDKLSKAEKQDVKDAIRIAISHVFGSKRRYLLHASTADKVASYVFGVPAKVKATHPNPWFMKDIDARHDLWFYMRVVQRAMEKYHAKDFGELGRMNPYAEMIWDLEGVMREVGKEVPMIGRFPEIENARAAKLRMPQPFDAQSRLMICSAAGEDIDAAIEDLEQRTRAYKNQLETCRAQGLFPDAAYDLIL
ncbi:MAG: hypothetical protein KJ574_02515 [Nanoarchaeota archaeon]|nr:hypothetical protein [Nanoarchaeota archaeon]